MSDAAKKQRPALARRVVVYDLRDDERDAARERASHGGWTLSRWIADVVRAELDRAEKRAKNTR